MNISLERLVEGIIATLRTDVIPNVGDAYARGQAVGVIDVLNTIAARAEWSRQPVILSLHAKRNLLAAVHALVPDAAADAGITIDAEASTAELEALSDRLDAAICEAIAVLHERASSSGKAREALGVIKAALHDELTTQMKSTRKPLFAEIAAGAEKKASGSTDQSAQKVNSR
jgi:hypothetical protein